MVTKYAIKEVKENMAKALSKDLGISAKVSIEIANFLRGKTTAKAKEILEDVIEYVRPIPFTRFTDGVGHRRGHKIGPGRFPNKASKEFLRLINSVEANAQAKGLSTELKIVHLAAQRGTNQFRSGRQRRRLFKRTHLEIVVEEMEAPKKKTQKKATKQPTSSPNTEKATGPQPTAKVETKPVEKKATPKPAEKKPEPKKESKPVEKKPEPAEKKSESKPEPKAEEIKK